MNEHPTTAKEYESLKLELWKSTSMTETLIPMQKGISFASGQQKHTKYTVTDTDELQFVAKPVIETI